MTNRDQNAHDEFPDVYFLEGYKTGPTSVVQAWGVRQGSGILVFAGSIAASEELLGLQRTPGYARQRQDLIAAGVLVSNPVGGLLLNVHHFFNSPSAASCVMLGASSNGRNVWRRLVDHRSISELEETDGEEVTPPTLLEVAQALEALSPEQLGIVWRVIQAVDDDTASATDS